MVVRNAGGWAKYKEGVASLLKSKDLVVRRLRCHVVADLGDKAHASDLLALLQSPPIAGNNNVFFPDWDRGCAAQALGIIGDRDHINDVAKFLTHRSANIRAGTAIGLGWMQAKDRQKEIAALLDDREENVVCSAIDALTMLGEKQYAGRFAKIAIEKNGDLVERSSALSALVAMQAVEQVPEIAKLLQFKDDRLARGEAMTALALLNRKEYSKDFAALLADKDMRGDAMTALAIMNETQYADKIAPFLHSEERSDRQAAAWSLITMESKQHAAAAIDVYSAFEQEQAGIPRNIPASAKRSLKKRFEDSLSRLKKNR